MFVCPYDTHWCDLTSCESDGCQLSGERPLWSCHGCGVLIIRTTAAFGLCVECITVEVKQKKKGA
jgi:hypothetical protein